MVSALAGLTGCGGRAVSRPPAGGDAAPRATLADEDHVAPSYGKAELARARIAERGAEAALERRIAELEARQAALGQAGATAAIDDLLGVARADLAVRRRFIAALEACEASGRWCPPRLDDPPWAYAPDPGPPRDPPLTVTLRFDLDSWRAIAAELYGRACACRTLACIDSVGVAIDELEFRPMPAVQGDDQASAAITRARECLLRLRGKRAAPAGEPR